MECACLPRPRSGPGPVGRECGIDKNKDARVVDKNEIVMYPYNKEVRNHACQEDVQEPDNIAQGDC